MNQTERQLKRELMTKYVYPEKIRAQSLCNAHPDRVNIVNECLCTHERKHRHHFDYSRPYDIVLLCPHCHAQEHKNRKRVNVYDLLLSLKNVIPDTEYMLYWGWVASRLPDSHKEEIINAMINAAQTAVDSSTLANHGELTGDDTVAREDSKVLDQAGDSYSESVLCADEDLQASRAGTV